LKAGISAKTYLEDRRFFSCYSIVFLAASDFCHWDVLVIVLLGCKGLVYKIFHQGQNKGFCIKLDLTAWGERQKKNHCVNVKW